MNHSGLSLSDFFQRHRRRGDSLALATIVHTIGSTYRKAGAQMLIAYDGGAAGLLSGGCLEADLIERARAVIDTGRPMPVDYDTRSSDDVLWGIGLGCEGAMTILLTRLSAANGYQPFAYIEDCRAHESAGRFALVKKSTNPAYPIGSAYFDGASAAPPDAVRMSLATRESTVSVVTADDAEFLIVPIEPPLRLLVLGAGPDAMLLVEVAGLMGWRISVFDHRPAYAVSERFLRAHRVVVNPAQELPRELARSEFDAAVVMSHHLTSDQIYLDALAESPIRYIGLLGPALRRKRLLSELGDKAAKLDGRLRGPIGLDIGAKTPETIALAIVSEIQAALSGRPGRPFSERQ
jgi:xanthine dehydrogenase accessory factor